MTDVELLIQSVVREQATWIEIDRSALRHNLAQIISRTLPSATIMAVVKANAYGHGLFEVVESIRDEVSYFGVASIDEALMLREHGIETPILLFGVPFGNVIDQAIHAEVSLAISSLEQAKEISERAERVGRPVMIHIKVDTGMGRLGIPAAQAIEIIEAISKLEMLGLEGIFTHFPQGEDEKDPFTQEQIHFFHKLIEKIGEKGIHFAYRHAANSTGIAHHKEAHFNLVRPGLTLYGLYSSESLKKKFTLKPVLSWKARIILIKKLRKGESSGYSRTFIADRDTTIGIIPVGYSHGYPFALSNKSTVLYKGKRFPVVGRVSMDYIAVDFGENVGKASVGETVTLLGRDSGDHISAEYLAELAGTIPYEIVTRLNPAIPRIAL